MNEPWSKTIKKRSSLYLRDDESDIHETGMGGSWYVLVRREKEPLLWTPPLPSNGRKTSILVMTSIFGSLSSFGQSQDYIIIIIYA